MDSLIRKILDTTAAIGKIERRLLSKRHRRQALPDLMRVADLVDKNRDRCTRLFRSSASSVARTLAHIHANLNRISLWICCRAVAYPEEQAEEIRLQARERFYARPVRLGDQAGETNHASNEDG